MDTIYIGVDFHARQQTICYLRTEDGEVLLHQLKHQTAGADGRASSFFICHLTFLICHRKKSPEFISSPRFKLRFKPDTSSTGTEL
jgi:hypothetical protein